MRFNLTLAATERSPILTLNYQYPLSAAIYKVIQKADSSFAAFLHNTGYGKGHHCFKLFTFSDIKTAFRISGDRLQMLDATAQLTVCFYIPEAAENFIKGLFIHQQLEIADKKSKATFNVQQVESMPSLIKNTFDEMITVTVQPLSPVVTGRKNEKSYYDYLSPTDAGFTECLLHNWFEKYKAVHNVDEGGLLQLKEQTKIKVLLFSQPPKQRLITIKQGTAEETKIRGYTKFRLQLTAPEALLQLALDAGLGLHNSLGCGCVEVVNH